MRIDEDTVEWVEETAKKHEVAVKSIIQRYDDIDTLLTILVVAAETSIEAYENLKAELEETDKSLDRQVIVVKESSKTSSPTTQPC
jgi:hypothetical protein